MGSETAKVWTVKIVETIVIRRGIYISKNPTINALSRTRSLRWNWFVHVPKMDERQTVARPSYVKPMQESIFGNLMDRGVNEAISLAKTG